MSMIIVCMVYSASDIKISKYRMQKKKNNAERTKFTRKKKTDQIRVRLTM